MTGQLVSGPWPGVPIDLTAATRRRGVPPTAGYLAERQRLGIPSHAEAIGVRCPWCGASAFRSCTVPGFPGKLRPPHEARLESAARSEAAS